MRSPPDILFLVCCLLLTAHVLIPELVGEGKTKDYPLWFLAGQKILQGQDLYPSGVPHFPFMYPPLPAILLAIPSYFGTIPLYICLLLFNSFAWWVTIHLSNEMAGTGKVPDLWVAALPAVVTIPFVFDVFDLGQPNLVLLALMLSGFWLLQRKQAWAAAAMFALAAAIKAFPIAVLPYLLWRRHWAAAVSMMAFLGIFLVLVPAPIRGYERNLSELSTWFRGMVGSSSEQGFGQRPKQNWSWKNQSLIAVTHRLTRPVNYYADEPTKTPSYVNLLDLDFDSANWIVLAASFLIGLGFLAVMPAQGQRTRLSNAAELGILFCLMTVASPSALQYYFLWLFFPITVLIQRAAYDPRAAVRVGTWLLLAVVGGLLALSFPFFPRYFAAIGNNIAATCLIVAALIWHMRHQPAGHLQQYPVPGRHR